MTATTTYSGLLKQPDKQKWTRNGLEGSRQIPRFRQVGKAPENAGALLQFMKTGDPNGGGPPNWPKYTPENGETMILDDVCEVQNDPDREARRALPQPA